MGSTLRNNFIYIVVLLIGALLCINIILTNRNNAIIQHNKALQEDIRRIRVYYDQIGKVLIHSLDIGLRGYAITGTQRFLQPMDNAVEWQDSIFQRVEVPLYDLGYRSAELSVLKDSLNRYIRYCYRLKDLLDQKKQEEFLNVFSTDKGAYLWGHYIACERSVNGFLKELDREAQTEYEEALSRNHLIQILLFLISFPTLLYTAYHTQKNFKLSALLHQTESEKNKLLQDQNIFLEHKVAERTQILATQNEEIISQTEELAAHRDVLEEQNRKLQEAQDVIEEQNKEIQFQNQHLESEVQVRTQELQNANKQLIEHNNQLEQFAFIAAHNLRAPLARILGLVNVMKISDTEEDKFTAMDKLVFATLDLDNVIKDLNIILEIKKHTGNLTDVNLTNALSRVLQNLEEEIKETHAHIEYDFTGGDDVYAVGPYVESILYNLISNALKYRHPDRLPFITLKTIVEADYLCLRVQDNGLGIDLSKYRHNMFNLYKRFHIHMEGKGLGLYLVKTQITALGGKVEVESTLEKGTTFLIYFKRIVLPALKN